MSQAPSAWPIHRDPYPPGVPLLQHFFITSTITQFEKYSEEWQEEYDRCEAEEATAKEATAGNDIGKIVQWQKKYELLELVTEAMKMVSDLKAELRAVLAVTLANDAAEPPASYVSPEFHMHIAEKVSRTLEAMERFRKKRDK